MADVAVLDIKVRTKEVKDAKTDLDNLTSAGRSLAGGLAALGAAAAAANAVMQAARYQTMGIVMETVGNAAGYTAGQMREFSESLQKQGISMLGAEESLSKAALANMDLAQATTLANAAQGAAILMGRTSTEAFEAMTTAIATGLVVNIHRLGIMADFEGALQREATALGKSKEKLTDREKIHARTVEVIAKSANAENVYTAAMMTAGKQITSTTRYLEDLSVLLGSFGLDTFTNAVFGANNALVMMNDKLRELKENGTLGQWSQGISSAIGTIIHLAIDAAAAFGIWFAVMSAAKFAPIIGAVAAFLGTLTTVSGAAWQAGVALEMFGAQASSALAVVGGPWVVGLTLAGIALYKLATYQTEAQKTLAEYSTTIAESTKKIQLAAEGAGGWEMALRGVTKSQKELMALEVEENMAKLAAATAEIQRTLGSGLEKDSFDPMTISVAELTAAMNPLGNQFKAIVYDMKSGMISATDAAIAFEKLRRSMSPSDGNKEFKDQLSEMARTLNQLSGASEAMAKYQKQLDALRNDKPAEQKNETPKDTKAEIEAQARKMEEARKMLADAKWGYKIAQAEDEGRDEYYIKQFELVKEHEDKLSDLRKKLVGAKGESATLKEAINLENQRFAQKSANIGRESVYQTAATYATMEQTIAENKGVDSYNEQIEAIKMKYELIRQTKAGTQEALMADRMEASEYTKIANSRVLAERQAGAELAALNSNTQLNLSYQREILVAELAKTNEANKQALLRQKIADIDAQSRGDIWYAAQKSLNAYADDAMNRFKNMENFVISFAKNTEDALVSAFTGGKDAFKNFADSVIKDIIRIQVRESITGPLAKGISSGSLWSGITSLFSANGNVLSGPGISALSGGVYNQPTAFGYNQHMTAFANGGVLGEAGPEAVMPLARTSDGKLGVRTTDDSKSGGTQTVTVIMKDAKGNQTAAPMSFNTNGMREFILNVVRDGSERGLLGTT